MGFWDFLKKIGGEKKEEPVIPSSIKENTIKTSEIESFIEKKKEETEKENKQLLSIIKERLNQAVKELEKEKKDIENVDLAKHKVESKIKQIVKQNLDNYSDYLGRLIKGLKELESVELDRLIPRINFLFYDFEKKSVITLQKATFLIGKELEAVRMTNKNFFKDLKMILDSNKELADNTKTISSLNEKIGGLKENTINEVKTRIFDSQNAIELWNGEISKMEEQIKETKNSDEHKRREKIEENIEKLDKELRQQISSLSGLIDFRALANVIHTNKKKMEILNEYKSDFESVFLRENGAKIIALLKETNMNNERITAKLKDVEDARGRVDYQELELTKTGKDKVKELHAEIEKAKERITKWEKDIDEDKRKLSKFESQKKEVLDSVKADLLKLKVELAD